MTPSDLTREGFDYDFNKNRYILKKRDFLGGMEFRTKKKNYTITVQYSDQGIAWVTVQFTNPDVFHDIISYVQLNEIEYRETFAGDVVKMYFEEEGYRVEMQCKPVKKTNVYTSENGMFSRVHDISHENFTYTIDTGKKPSSPWHDRQEKKIQRRQRNGVKAVSVRDYM